MLLKTPRRAAATIALLLLTSTSAYAVDAQAFADRLKTVLADQGIDISYSAAEESGDDVVLKGVTVVAEDADPYGLGDLTFNGVTGSTAEGWKVASVPIADIDTTGGDTHTQVTGIVIEGLELAGTEAAAGPAPVTELYFEHAAIDDVDISRGGKTAFSLEGAEITNEISADGSFSSEFNLGDFQADFTAGEMSTDRQIVDDLGYGQISGSGSGAASWDPSTGELSLDSFELAVDDAGQFNFSYSIAGYTPDFIQSLKQVQQQMAESPDNNEAVGMAVLGLISQLSLQSAEVSFVDDSLVDRLLDYYAKQAGQTREQMVEGLTAMVPAFLVYLQNPEFQTEVANAIEAFLADPQSLTISIDPAAPVPAAQIIGAAMGAPQTLPSVLSLEVSANEASGDTGGAGDDSGDAEMPAATDTPPPAANGTEPPAATDTQTPATNQ